MNGKEAIIYVAAGLAALLVLGGLVIGFRYGQAKLFYNGDMRCIFAECRINIDK